MDDQIKVSAAHLQEVRFFAVHGERENFAKKVISRVISRCVLSQIHHLYPDAYHICLSYQTFPFALFQSRAHLACVIIIDQSK